MQLRDYQARAVEEATALLRRGHRTLVVAPPGAGKTPILCDVARRYAQGNRRVLIMGHRRELLAQTHNHLRQLGVPKNRIGSIYPEPDSSEDASRPIQVASVQTLLVRGERPPADLVILDEAHHGVADAQGGLLDDYRGSHLLGLTATPVRLDRRGLGDIFDRMVVGALPSELIGRKFLARPNTFTALEEFTPNMRNVHRALGDYVPREVHERVNQDPLIGNIVEHYQDRCKGRTAIVFAANTVHSASIVERFRSAGIQAEHLEGSMSIPVRDAIVGRLRSGATRVVSNVGILHEGFDLPRTYAVILARPTLSLALYIQQAGRALRRFRNMRPLILDHAGNYTRFGLSDADREWSLHNTIPDPSGGGIAPARACPRCQFVMPLGCVNCPNCGLEMQDPTPVLDEDEDRQLEEATRANLVEVQRRMLQFAEETGRDGEAWTARMRQAIKVYTGFEL